MMQPGMPPMAGMPQMQQTIMPPGAQMMVPPAQYMSYPAGAPPTEARAPPLPTDKEQLGEYLYPLVEAKDAQNAAKITGMLLEMEVDQIHNIIRNQVQLDKWISEALKILTSSAPSAQ